MSETPRKMGSRNTTFMRWLITAIAVAWIYEVVTDYQLPPAQASHLLLHWLLACCTTGQAFFAWWDYYQRKRAGE